MLNLEIARLFEMVAASHDVRVSYNWDFFCNYTNFRLGVFSDGDRPYAIPYMPLRTGCATPVW